MSTGFRAVELEGAIDEQHRLHVEESLPDAPPGRVRVLVLIPETDEPSEAEWLRAMATNPAFDFLNDPAEDMYSLADGKPFHDQR
jgi:hypothetical protein